VLRGAQEGADESVAELALARARVAELEGEVRQLRPAGIRARELEDRIADRDQRLEKLRAEVRSATNSSSSFLSLDQCTHAKLVFFQTASLSCLYWVLLTRLCACVRLPHEATISQRKCSIRSCTSSLGSNSQKKQCPGVHLLLHPVQQLIRCEGITSAHMLRGHIIKVPTMGGVSVQVSELRPLKASSARTAGYEVELAERQRQIKELREQLSAAKARSQMASRLPPAPREDPRPAAREAPQPALALDAEVTCSP
jgi:hypothetical protein